MAVCGRQLIRAIRSMAKLWWCVVVKFLKLQVCGDAVEMYGRRSVGFIKSVVTLWHYNCSLSHLYAALISCGPGGSLSIKSHKAY